MNEKEIIDRELKIRGEILKRNDLLESPKEFVFATKMLAAKLKIASWCMRKDGRAPDYRYFTPGKVHRMVLMACACFDLEVSFKVTKLKKEFIPVAVSNGKGLLHRADVTIEMAITDIQTGFAKCIRWTGGFTCPNHMATEKANSSAIKHCLIHNFAIADAAEDTLPATQEPLTIADMEENGEEPASEAQKAKIKELAAAIAMMVVAGNDLAQDVKARVEQVNPDYLPPANGEMDEFLSKDRATIRINALNWVLGKITGQELRQQLAHFGETADFLEDLGGE